MHDLVDLDCNIFLQPQSVPLVIDRDDLALQSLARSITVFPEKSSVEPPFQVHRILGKNGVLVLGVEGHPFTVDLDLGAGYVKDEALIPFLGQVDGFIRADG